MKFYFREIASTKLNSLIKFHSTLKIIETIPLDKILFPKVKGTTTNKISLMIENNRDDAFLVHYLYKTSIDEKILSLEVKESIFYHRVPTQR